jgi:hypothetical protein
MTKSNMAAELAMALVETDEVRGKMPILNLDGSFRPWIIFFKTTYSKLKALPCSIHIIVHYLLSSGFYGTEGTYRKFTEPLS